MQASTMSPHGFVATLPSMCDVCKKQLLQVVILIKVTDEANPPEDCPRMLATVCIKDQHGNKD